MSVGQVASRSATDVFRACGGYLSVKPEREAEDRHLCSVPEHQHDRVATQKHLGDEAVLVDRLLSLALGHLCPHLLDVLQHHVRVTVECFDSCEELLVVSKGDEDLCVVADGLLEDREGTLGDLVLFELADLGLVQFGLRYVDVLTVGFAKEKAGVKRLVLTTWMALPSVAAAFKCCSTYLIVTMAGSRTICRQDGMVGEAREEVSIARIALRDAQAKFGSDSIKAQLRQHF